MERKNLADRILQFSARVVRLVMALPATRPGKKIADELLRASTSVGANYEEAQGAESKADFNHKLQIALKEMRESRYWLCLISEATLLKPDLVEPLIQEATELRAILSKSVATAKGKARAPHRS
jgi:four helix bundle protein